MSIKKLKVKLKKKSFKKIYSMNTSQEQNF